MQEIEKIIQSGQDSIVQRALGIIIREVDTTRCRITLLRGTEDLFVGFTLPVSYVPLNSQAYYGVSVLILQSNFMDNKTGAYIEAWHEHPGQLPKSK